MSSTRLESVSNRDAGEAAVLEAQRRHVPRRQNVPSEVAHHDLRTPGLLLGVRLMTQQVVDLGCQRRRIARFEIRDGLGRKVLRNGG